MRSLGDLVAAASLWLAAGPVLAQTQVITNPDWLEQPSGEDFADHYPKLAAALEVDGLAQITCSVSEQGRLEACRVDTEGPKDFGFGRAALAMSSAFRMKPQMVDGKPVAGGVVCIPIRFLFPATSPAPATPVASPAVRAKALRAVEPQAAGIEAATEAQVVELLEGGDPHADLAARQEAAKAIRAAAAQYGGRLRGELADALIASLSPDEIDALAALVTALGGRQARTMPELEHLSPEIASRVSAYMLEELRAAYCRQASCEATPAELSAVAGAAGGVTMEVERWARQAPIAQIMTVTPVGAQIFGVSGRARLTCEAAPDGVLRSCAVAAEAPVGWKFGDAALKLAKAYQLEPAGADRNVTLRVNFVPTPLTPVEPVARASSPAAAALARKLLLSQFDPHAMVAAKGPTLAAALATQVTPDATPAAEAAVRSALQRSIERVMDDVSNLIAAEYTEAELSAIVAYVTSPAGKSTTAKAAAVDGSMYAAMRRSQALVAAGARATFCKDRDCAPPTALAQVPRPPAPAPRPK